MLSMIYSLFHLAHPLYVPGSLPGWGDRELNKIDKVPDLVKKMFYWWRKIIKKKIDK